MRWVVVGALAACGSTTPAGTISVTVYSNGMQGGDSAITPAPLAGLTVFEAGGNATTTDAMGHATLEVDHDPATIHVANFTTASTLTTVAGVPVGGEVRLGNAPFFANVGTMSVTLEDIGATGYTVIGPRCLSYQGATGNHVALEFDSSCAGKVVRVVGEAITASGVKIVEQDIGVGPNAMVTLGAFTDATTYAPVVINAPDLPVAPVATIGLVGTSGLAVMFRDYSGPADANRVVLDAIGNGSGSSLVVDGPIGSTVDASRMLPVPQLGTVDAHGAAWSIADSAAQPNLVQLRIAYDSTSWLIYAPPSTTHVAFPHLPGALASHAPSGAPTGVMLDYLVMPRDVLTSDELFGSWDGLTAPRQADHQPIAISQATRL